MAIKKARGLVGIMDIIHHTDEGALGLSVLEQSATLVDAVNIVRSGIAYKRSKERNG